MSTLLTRLMRLAENNPAQPLSEKAKKILTKIALPQKINAETINKYIRKAHRTGAWRNLKQENKALLIALRKWKNTIKSRTLTTILHKILLQIELHTLRGQALYYGIIIALKNSIHKLKELIKNTTRLLVIGISYLNSPPMYRIYG